MSSDDPTDERVIYRERFQAGYFDFRGKSIFTRFDRCEFVKCTLLIDHATEQLALPSGQDHHNALREIGRFRVQIAALQGADLRPARFGLKAKGK